MGAWATRIVAAAALVAAVIVAAAVISGTRSTCARSAATLADWRQGARQRPLTGAEGRIAHHLVECKDLIGLSRRDARALFAEEPRRPGAGLWGLPAGEVNDYMGPGDGQRLDIRFEDDRIVSARYLYPE